MPSEWSQLNLLFFTIRNLTEGLSTSGTGLKDSWIDLLGVTRKLCRWVVACDPWTFAQDTKTYAWELIVRVQYEMLD